MRTGLPPVPLAGAAPGGGQRLRPEHLRPALLLCGSRDQAASTRRYNRAWAKTTGLPLVWVPHAGHNSNTDNPAFVNQQIDAFVRRL